MAAIKLSTFPSFYSLVIVPFDRVSSSDVLYFRFYNKFYVSVIGPSLSVTCCPMRTISRFIILLLTLSDVFLAIMMSLFYDY